jgi:GNAT superfamily N-acetyltransferase
MNRTLAVGAVSTGCYCVRAGGPADTDAIREFLTSLSPQTRYFRFFAALGPTPGLLRVLSGGSPGTDILIISDGNGAIVGHGMAAPVTAGGRPGVDVGLVVADSWQGQGLGTLLLRLLVARAAERGIGTVLVEVLPENARMLGLMDRHFPLARRTWNGDAISVMADIPAGNHGAARRHDLTGNQRARAPEPEGARREPHPAAA